MKYTDWDNTPGDRIADRVADERLNEEVRASIDPADPSFSASGRLAAALTEALYAVRTTVAAGLAWFSANGLVTSAGLAIDAVPEKFQTTKSFIYTIAGSWYTLPAQTALPYTAAHPVTASKFGVIQYLVDAAGVITTKVPGATQTTTQAYATAAAALAAKLAVDDTHAELGWSIIEADAGGWVAQTDDLTDGGDLVTATFVDADLKTPVS